MEALRYLLVPPTDDEIAKVRQESQPIIDLDHHHDLLITGGWGVDADMLVGSSV